MRKGAFAFGYRQFLRGRHVASCYFRYNTCCFCRGRSLAVGMAMRVAVFYAKKIRFNIKEERGGYRGRGTIRRYWRQDQGCQQPRPVWD